MIKRLSVIAALILTASVLLTACDMPQSPPYYVQTAYQYFWPDGRQSAVISSWRWGPYTGDEEMLFLWTDRTQQGMHFRGFAPGSCDYLDGRGNCGVEFLKRDRFVLFLYDVEEWVTAWTTELRPGEAVWTYYQ